MFNEASKSVAPAVGENLPGAAVGRRTKAQKLASEFYADRSESESNRRLKQFRKTQAAANT
jgi:hypothetical protein